MGVSTRESAPWQGAADPETLEWFELLCHTCGSIVYWVNGTTHVCPAGGKTRRAGDGHDAEQEDLTGEIETYLASDQGRYDALIAALIIRAR